jgi:general secretion pathway protein D
MTPSRTAAALLAAIAAQTAVFAQFDTSDRPTRSAWSNFKLDPKARVTLDFRNANIDAVLQMLSRASGVTIIKDPALTGGITLQSPTPQSLNDAFALLNAVLGLKNYTLARDGNFLVVQAKSQRPAFGRGGFPGMNMDGGGAFGGGRSQSVLRVYAIKYANATQVARVINEVFANSGGNQDQAGGGNNPGGNIPGGFPGFPGAPGGNAGGGGGRFNFGGAGGGFGRRPGGAAAASSVVRASADDFSNSVIVNAPRSEQDQVEDLINEVDKQTEQPQQSRVFPLRFANAADMQPVVQSVLASNAPRGRGGATGASQTPIDQRFQFGARFGQGGASGAGGSVVAEARTNSLVVTATADNLELVGKVVKELDTEVKFENSTFVLTLENARADLIADLVNQSFGSRTGAGGARTTATTGRTGTTGNANRTSGNNRNTGLTGNNRGGPNNEALPVDLVDPNAEAGELATAVTVQQGFGFGQGGFGFGQGGTQNRNNQTRQQATGLDSQGRVVNIRDLTGQVIAVPDINTNSVIIVTSPENRALLEQILTQLDRIPEQVMIETLIVEASLDASSKLGVEWNLSPTSLGTQGRTKGSGTTAFGLQADASQPQGLRYTISGPQYAAFIQALQTDSRFDVLSTPRIFTSNNSTAEINISQSLPYIVSQQTNAAGFITFNYAFLDVGIVLTVTPRITSNGYVTMDVTQTANDFVRYTDFNAPVVNQREAQTTVSVKDGETIVLGGIIKNSVSSTVNKLPILGDIPLLGNLFKSTGVTKSKTELLVFLTPRIVRDANEARRLKEDTEKKLQSKTLKRIEEVVKPVETPPVPALKKPK